MVGRPGPPRQSMDLGKFWGLRSTPWICLKLWQLGNEGILKAPAYSVSRHSVHLSCHAPLRQACTLEGALAHAPPRGAPSGPLLFHLKLWHLGKEGILKTTAYSVFRHSVHLSRYAPLRQACEVHLRMCPQGGPHQDL